MTCTGTGSCRQGRAQCRDGCNKLHQHNSDGSDAHQSNSPWDWIDDLSYPVDRALLIAIASVIVAVAWRIFH